MKTSKKGGAMLLIASMISIAFVVNAEEKIINRTEITEVKIFSSGATVTRNAKVTIDPGLSLLRFENLSSSIQPNSILVSATGEFTILSVTHQLDYLGPDRKTPEMIKLEDSLQVLNRKRDGILNYIAVLQEEQQLLLANKSIGGANTGVKLDELKNVAAFFRERMTEIKNTILDQNVKEKKLKQEIDKLNNQLALLNNRRNEPYSTILVNVMAVTKTAASFTISYYTGNVSWQPAYDIKVKDVSSPVELYYKAMVTQNTGEDWKQVKMKISTGNPSLGATAPELSPWYLSFLRPVTYPAQGRNLDNIPQMQIQAIQGVADGKKKEDAASVSEYIITTQTRFSSEYEITTPYSIPSDNLQYAVQIKEYKLPAEYSYFAVPKLDPDAFLVASVSGWEELDLQEGNANVYYENTFIGQSVFDPVTPDDTLKISLGRDKRIVIKREKLKDVAGNQLIGQHRNRAFTYETMVKSNRKETISLTIEDQVPVSADKDIEVKMTDVSGGTFNPETGKVTWKVELGTGQQAKKKLSYSIKYPKDRQVSGI